MRLQGEQCIYYSFTIAAAQSGTRRVPPHFRRVCAGRITGLRVCLNLAPQSPHAGSINAFLTLNAVTKW